MSRSARTVLASAVLAPLAVVGLGACSTGVHHAAKLATGGPVLQADSGGADTTDPVSGAVAKGAHGRGVKRIAGATTTTSGHGTGAEGGTSGGGTEGSAGGGTAHAGVPASGGSDGSTSSTEHARFTSVHVTYPAVCEQGTLVTPKLTWHTVGTSGAAVSVDNPGLVGAFGSYDGDGTLDMPTIACSGTAGSHTAPHRYDLDTIGGVGHDHATRSVSMTVHVTLPPPVTMPPVTAPPYSLPPISLPPVTVPPITLPPITIPCPFC